VKSSHAIILASFENIGEAGGQIYEACPKSIRLHFFPGKTSDGRLANLITVVGGTFMRMRDLLRPRPVRLSLLGS
jgi:hypothetical protein